MGKSIPVFCREGPYFYMWEGFCCMREEHKILQQVYAAKEDVQAADQLIVAYNKFNVFNDTQEATCGFLSFNTGMKIRNYMATQDAAELEEIRSRLQIA